MSIPEAASAAIIAIAVAVVIAAAASNHRNNQNAPNGWYYIYWQPWRRWAIGILCGGFIACLVVFAIV